ncbi:MAG TPA: YggS family pyridoxal phosphate-dependent enzyme [Chitinophagaceae bacterium]|nr:YggS family pyridoxal phosphate-dependent enzyme [Chitinophagaceae bacterium]
MPVNKQAYKQISTALDLKKVKLVAVSKTKPVAEIFELYNLGQRDFGENYVQELAEKRLLLPHDIRWHFIGHLQTNKVRYIAPFVHLIHGVDSFKLLVEINKQGMKNHRIIECLLQVHIAQEETKFGLNEAELDELIDDLQKLDGTDQLHFVKITGLMGMASFTTEEKKIRREFKYLASLYDKYSNLNTTNLQFKTLSMGMSADYKIAIEEGSNLVRIGSLIFGER